MTHNTPQPPEHEEPEKEDLMYAALSELAGIYTHDINLRDHPAAYEILDRLMLHAYAEGRKDEADASDAGRYGFALQEISAMTYDPWSNGARAKDIAEAALRWSKLAAEEKK